MLMIQLLSGSCVALLTAHWLRTSANGSFSSYGRRLPWLLTYTQYVRGAAGRRMRISNADAAHLVTTEQSPVEGAHHRLAHRAPLPIGPARCSPGPFEKADAMTREAREIGLEEAALGCIMRPAFSSRQDPGDAVALGSRPETGTRPGAQERKEQTWHVVSSIR
jgi:hypothetical protein